MRTANVSQPADSSYETQSWESYSDSYDNSSGRAQAGPQRTSPRHLSHDEEDDEESEWRIAPGGRSIPTSRLLMSLNQLAVMSQNGIDLSEALETAAKSARHTKLADCLEAIHESINAGVSLSAAMETHGEGLPRTLPAMIAAAESTGDVPRALQRFCELLRNELQLRSSIMGALIYPVILILVSVAVMLAMLFGVLPQFGEVFTNMGRPVPDSTKILLGAGQWCRENMAWCGAGLVGLMVAGFCFRNHPLTRRAFDWLLTYAPIIRSAYRPLACGRLFRLIGSMLAGGVPLLEAIRLTQRSVSNGYFRELLEQIEEDVLAGDHMNRAMVDADFLPPEAAQMVATAERTGRLADVLMDCGLFYEEQGERLLRKVVHSLEPVIILAMGVLVAGVVLSIMLPLLDMSSVA